MQEHTRKLLKDTIHVAWPSITETMLISLISLVDTLMVSSLGEAAIAAIGLTTQPKFIFLTLFISLNTSLSSIVARRKGQNNRESANKTFRLVMGVSLVLIALCTFLALRLDDPIIRMAGSMDDTHEMAKQYFDIIMGGMFFNCATMIMTGAQRGAGNTRISMTTNLSSNIVNVILNYLLITGRFGFPALGIRGAAIATVAGTMVGFCIAVRSMLKKDGFVSFRYRYQTDGMIDRLSLRSLGSITGATFIEQLFMRIGFLTYSMIVARLGTKMFAAHQVGMNFLNISFSIGDGLAIAAITLVGQALGRQDRKLAKDTASMCQKIGICFSCLLALIYTLFGRPLFSLFTDDMEILGYGDIICRYIVVIVMLQISQVVFRDTLRSAGDNRFTAMVSFISITIVRPLLGYLFVMTLGMGIRGAWLGLLADQFTRFILTLFRFRSGKWLNIIV